MSRWDDARFTPDCETEAWELYLFCSRITPTLICQSKFTRCTIYQWLWVRSTKPTTSNSEYKSGIWKKSTKKRAKTDQEKLAFPCLLILPEKYEHVIKMRFDHVIEELCCIGKHHHHHSHGIFLLPSTFPSSILNSQFSFTLIYRPINVIFQREHVMLTSRIEIFSWNPVDSSKLNTQSIKAFNENVLIIVENVVFVIRTHTMMEWTQYSHWIYVNAIW